MALEQNVHEYVLSDLQTEIQVAVFSPILLMMQLNFDDAMLFSSLLPDKFLCPQKNLIGLQQ